MARVVAGVLIGLVVSTVVTRMMTTILYGVTPLDPLTLTVSAVLLCVVALAACYLPARRATRLDPLVALRAE